MPPENYSTLLQVAHTKQVGYKIRGFTVTVKTATSQDGGHIVYAMRGEKDSSGSWR